MFTRFDEAGRRRERWRWVALVSVAAHAAVLWLGVAASTGRADPAPAPRPELRPIYVAPVREPAAPRQPAARRSGDPAPGGPAEPSVPTIAPPAVVPPGLPPIEPGVVVDADEWIVGARGSAGGAPGDSTARGGGGGAGGAWTGDAVDVSVAPRRDNPVPRYPTELERSGVTGRVVARYVVDSTGRVEPGSIVIVASDHPAFADAVRRTLPRYRFEAARVGGGRVRQLVEMPFEFAVRP